MSHANSQARLKALRRGIKPHGKGAKIPKPPRYNENGAMFIDDPPKLWTPEPPAVDLSKCPKCGGPADNGHDRCLPPNPYFCSECSGDAR